MRVSPGSLAPSRMRGGGTSLTTTPFSIITTRSEMDNAKSISWVTISIVIPSRARD